MLVSQSMMVIALSANLISSQRELHNLRRGLTCQRGAVESRWVRNSVECEQERNDQMTIPIIWNYEFRPPDLRLTMNGMCWNSLAPGGIRAGPIWRFPLPGGYSCFGAKGVTLRFGVVSSGPGNTE